MAKTRLAGAVVVVMLITSPLMAQTRMSPLDRGAELYQRNCSHCHGVALDGKGPDAGSFDPPPANFHRYLSRLKNDTELANTIKEGRRFLGMHNWGDTLTDEQVQDLIVYIRSAAPQVRAKP